MRSEIATYLQQGPEGKFYYRMVDTVLLRDKNWVRWKAENCPPYDRPSITAIEFVEARDNAHKACSNKRLRATPLGSLDLSFLSDGESIDGLNKLKDPAR
jgi:THO complex subunit 1